MLKFICSTIYRGNQTKVTTVDNRVVIVSKKKSNPFAKTFENVTKT